MSETDPIRAAIDGTPAQADAAQADVTDPQFASGYSEYETPDAARQAALKKALRAIDTDNLHIDTEKVLKYLERGQYDPDSLDGDVKEAIAFVGLKRYNRSSLNPRGPVASAPTPDAAHDGDAIIQALRAIPRGVKL